MVIHFEMRGVGVEARRHQLYKMVKGGNWDNNSGQGDPHGLDRVQCLDGYMEYVRENREWTEVRE